MAKRKRRKRPAGKRGGRTAGGSPRPSRPGKEAAAERGPGPDQAEAPAAPAAEALAAPAAEAPAAPAAEAPARAAAEPDPADDGERVPQPDDAAEQDDVPRLLSFRPPPRGFWIGALFGLVVASPAFAALAMGLAALGLVETADPETLLGLAAAFATLPAALSAGGIGRLVVRSIVFGHRLRRALGGAALRFAVAGAGLVVLVAVPASPTPDTERWWMIPSLGAAAGALLGIVMALLIGYAARAWLRDREHALAGGREAPSESR